MINLIRTVEELREKTWELDTSTRYFDPKNEEMNQLSYSSNPLQEQLGVLRLEGGESVCKQRRVDGQRGERGPQDQIWFLIKYFSLPNISVTHSNQKAITNL